MPGDKWQYRGVISMFCICQRKAESMTKQWHTLYGYAGRPEKVSWTSPCRVSSSFSSTIYSPLSTTRPRISGPHSMSTTNLESPSSTSLNDNTYIWRGEGKETVCCCNQRWLCAGFASESFILFLPSVHCFLNLMDSFKLVDMKADSNCLLT